MNELSKSKEFHIGLTMGVNIVQKLILVAHERGEPLMIESKPYYILDAEQLLQQMLDSVCR